MNDKYISISQWGMFKAAREYPPHVRHEPEVRDAIRAKHKLFERVEFPRVEKIADFKI